MCLVLSLLFLDGSMSLSHLWEATDKKAKFEKLDPKRKVRDMVPQGTADSEKEDEEGSPRDAEPLQGVQENVLSGQEFVYLQRLKPKHMQHTLEHYLQQLRWYMMAGQARQ